MADCIFCKIAAGEIPCLRIFEDDDSLAFLDIAPLADGHSLLIPKAHFSTLDSMPPNLAAKVSQHLPRLVSAVMQSMKVDACNILQNNGAAAGQAVDHVHFHVIPRSPGDALGFRWPAGVYEQGREKEVHARILQAIR
jgi:histidine triad (HIT) family protein